MSDLLLLGHVTAYELPQFSLYMVFAFVAGVSVAVALNARSETDPVEDDE